jgi:hypothetical protein
MINLIPVEALRERNFIFEKALSATLANAAGRVDGQTETQQRRM